MKTKVLLFISILLFFQACGKDAEIKAPKLTDEAKSAFYERFEAFEPSPQELSTTVELKRAYENWFRQQPEVQNVKTTDNKLIFSLIDGSVTEIEFSEPSIADKMYKEEEFLWEPSRFEPETVDASFFIEADMQKCERDADSPNCFNCQKRGSVVRHCM